MLICSKVWAATKLFGLIMWNHKCVQNVCQCLQSMLVAVKTLTSWWPWMKTQRATKVISISPADVVNHHKSVDEF